MTNTMNTPAEALEITCPVRVEGYELREGSAGHGKHRGGNGLVRAIRTLDHKTRVSLQCERRRFAPYGLHGGTDAKPARNAVIRADGSIEEVPGKASLSLGQGDVVMVETSGAAMGTGFIGTGKIALWPMLRFERCRSKNFSIGTTAPIRATS